MHDADLLASTHLRMKDYDGSTSPQPELEASDTSLGEMEASDASVPFKHKVGHFIVALLATTLAIVASYAPTAADSSAPQRQ